ncbi:MAG: YchJ family metal-binding protein [Desulfuromonadales bacterium]
MHDYTPSELIRARAEAFSRGDFSFIFDSYHSESNFRRQFCAQEEYLQFAQASLGQDYRILNCRVLAEAVGEHEAQVIYLMEMHFQGNAQRYAELAWLQRENNAWRYHRGQKIAAEELPEFPESLGFADFAKLEPATIF